jgi:Activin types I and II receptor domain
LTNANDFYVADTVDLAAEPAVCEHYDAECERKGGGQASNCSSAVLACGAPDAPGKRTHCYALWRNVSGSVTVILKGCWLDYEECYDRRECLGLPTTHVTDGYFCCCDVDECNRNMSMSNNPRLTTLPSPSEFCTVDFEQESAMS